MKSLFATVKKGIFNTFNKVDTKISFLSYRPYEIVTINDQKLKPRCGDMLVELTTGGCMAHYSVKEEKSLFTGEMTKKEIIGGSMYEWYKTVSLDTGKPNWHIFYLTSRSMQYPRIWIHIR